MSSIGIYKITCVPTGKVYIGSSKNLKSRLQTHKRDLHKNCHPNRKLQNAWNCYTEVAFTFEVIETHEEYDCDYLINREQFWIDQFNALDPIVGFNLFAPARASELGNFNNSMACFRASQREGVKENRSKAAKDKYSNSENRELFKKQYGRYPTIKAEVTNLSTGEVHIFWSTREIASLIGVHMASVLNWMKAEGDKFEKKGYSVSILEK